MVVRTEQKAAKQVCGLNGSLKVLSAAGESSSVCKMQKVSFSVEEQLMRVSISYRPLERIMQTLLLSQQSDSPGVEFIGLASFDHFTIHSCFLLLV